MSLIGGTTQIAAALLTLTAVVGCVLLWNRLRGPRAAQLVARLGLIVLCQVLAIAAAGLSINAQYGFYVSWSELLGRSSLTAATAAPVVGRLDHAHVRQVRAAFRAGHGTIVPLVIPGTASGVPPQRALVYLPAAYGDPASAAVHFPVVELLLGFPGRPETWTRTLQLRQTLDAAIASRRSVPMIAVIPTQNIAFPRDTQCVDVVGGPKVDTFLTHDVRQAVVGAFRTLTDRGGWALMGYSTGGYCAVNLAMRHPSMFSSAVSLSGYAGPAHDRFTGNLFGSSVALARANSPLWREQHLPRPDLSVLLMTSRLDTVPYHDALRLAAAARAPLRVSTVIFARGGHNFLLWRAVEPYSFSWLSRQLRAPLAPAALPTSGRSATVLLAQGTGHR